MKVRIVVNKASVETYLPSDTDLTAFANTFDALREHSGWSDTGGGWRWIYRKLVAMMKAFIISDGTTQEHKSQYDCYLRIEKVEV